MKEDLLVGQAINAPRFAADQLPAASKSDPLDDDWAARGHMRTLVLMAAKKKAFKASTMAAYVSTTGMAK